MNTVLSPCVCVCVCVRERGRVGCTDAAKRPPHPRPTRPASSFFFPFPDSRRFAPTRSVSDETAETHRYRPEPANSGRNSKKKKVQNVPFQSQLTETAEIVRAQSQMAPPSSADLHLGFFLGKKIRAPPQSQWISSSSFADLLCFLFFLHFFTSSFSPPVVYLFK